MLGSYSSSQVSLVITYTFAQEDSQGVCHPERSEGPVVHV
jgi:hypothetical protein